MHSWPTLDKPKDGTPNSPSRVSGNISGIFFYRFEFCNHNTLYDDSRNDKTFSHNLVGERRTVILKTSRSYREAANAWTARSWEFRCLVISKRPIINCLCAFDKVTRSYCRITEARQPDLFERVLLNRTDWNPNSDSQGGQWAIKNREPYLVPI